MGGVTGYLWIQSLFVLEWFGPVLAGHWSVPSSNCIIGDSLFFIKIRANGKVINAVLTCRLSVVFSELKFMFPWKSWNELTWNPNCCDKRNPHPRDVGGKVRIVVPPFSRPSNPSPHPTDTRQVFSDV